MVIKRPVHGSGLPAQLFAVQGGVVKSPVRLKVLGQFPILVSIGEQAVLKSLQHLRTPEMAFQVFVNCPPNQFRIAQARCLGHRLEGSELLLGQKEIDS